MKNTVQHKECGRKEKKKEIKIMIHTLYYNSCQDEMFKAKSIIGKQFLKFSVLKTTGN